MSDGMSPDEEIDYWRTQAKMMAKAADNEKADRIAFRAERDQLRAELDRLNKYIATHDEEYLAMKDVLRAEHEACQRMRPVFEAAVKWREFRHQDLSLDQLRADSALAEAISSTLTPADGSGT